MNVILNGETRVLAEGRTLAEWLDELHLVPGRLACEVNGAVVRRADYARVQLAEGDRVEIVQMMGGG
jgi:thiamine biosynthesis protein ThiS